MLLPPGMPQSLDYPHCTVGDILAGTAPRHPDRVALRDGEESLTFAELYDQALRLAQGLRQHGVRPGDVVALHQPNSLRFTLTYFGVLLAGAVVSPFSPLLPAALLAEQLTEVSAVAVITHPAVAPVLAEARALASSASASQPEPQPKPKPWFVVEVPATHAAPGPTPGRPAGTASGNLPLAELLAADPAPATRVHPDDLAHLSFTGGTTGRSKAVRILHRHAVANALQMGCWRGASLPRLDDNGAMHLEQVPAAVGAGTVPIGESVLLSVAPMFHAMGLITQLLCTANATTVVVSGRFDPDRYLAEATRWQVTHLAGSPALFHALLAVPGLHKADLSSVRQVSSGAAPLDSETMARLRELLPQAEISEGYGLTEATMGLTGHPPEQPVAAPIGSVGVPVFDTVIEIRDPVTREPLPVGEVGEVWAHGPQIADGYHNHPELTAEQFEDGWLRTGDLGRSDQDGWLYLVGRAKDMLIHKGYNVYPAPLEDLLHQHPAVAVAAVVGAPDPLAGEIPVAHVVLRAGYDPSPELAEQLMAHVAAGVTPYQRVREVHFSAALPLSAAGKILKTELRRATADRRGAGGDAP
ncbi:class I adenylate-forming enzyme family protein [Streptacidiphilus carbonis]|uniref:class I adenylate-forming enzyme family protein n=1 Tax=Streptacidiphilus carbonis TaxID=105422 RepID=UPI0005A87017|nr:class I adenylate-forming enzyme family protein [Streptacidiphilus carbonis]